MCKIVAFVHLPACSLEGCVVEKGPQKFVVTSFRLVCSREYCVNYMQPTRWTNALCRNSVPCPHVAIQLSRVLECTHNRSSHRDEVAAPLFCALDCLRGYFWNPIWFVQRKQTIEFRVTCG